jgi:hypothetical protein
VDNPGDFQVVLSNPTGGAFVYAPLSQLDVTILDSDVPTPGHFVVVSSSFAENAGNATITVARLDGAQGAAQVDYGTSDGTATAGADYTAASGTLTFANGETSKTFVVPILPDDLVEGDETFLVTLSNPTGGATVGPLNDGGTQYNNPELETISETAGQVQFSAAEYRVAENNATLTVTVVFTLDPGAQLGGDPNTNGYAPVTVDYSTHDGTATAGADYTAVSGTLTINPYLTTQTFTIPILNDLLVEGNETFLLTLSNATGGARLGANGTATVTILDEDSQSATQTTTTLKSNLPNGSTYGQTLSLTATVGAGIGRPTGSVDFVDQATGRDLGSASLAVVDGVDEASIQATGLSAGPHTIVATYTSDTDAFATSNDSLAQSVAPATITVTANDKGKVYGAAIPPLTDTTSGFVNGDAPSVVTGAASLSTTASSASGVGNYAITVGAGTLSAANYTFDFVNGSLSVTPATLTVTADNKTMVYGATVPPLTDTITGFVNGDAATVVSGAASLNTTATAASGVGNYPINVSVGTLSAANYMFAFVDGTLSVTPTTHGSGEDQIAAVGIAFEGYEFSLPTSVTAATFTDGDNALPTADFSATIDWGDGTTTPGTVSLSSGAYTVTGAHEYLDEGHYTVNVNIAQTAGAATAPSTSVTTQATIHEQLLEDGSVGTPDQNWVQEVYRDLFDRQAELQGLNYWTGLLDAGQARGEVAYEIVQLAFSEEFQRDTVVALYKQYLDRAPDTAGAAYWTMYLYDGGTIESMAQALVSSQEYFQVRAGGTTEGFLHAVFHDAFGRDIDPTALSFFGGLSNNGTTAAEIAGIIFSSDEYHRTRVDSLFEQLLDRPADEGALSFFAAELDNGGTDEILITQIISSDEYFAKPQI